MSSKVKVVNPVWNGSGLIKHKVAEYYVSEGRAKWVGSQLRLNPSHPLNVAAAARANAWAADYRPTSDRDPITQALRLFGPSPASDKYGRGGGGLSAVNHAKTRFQRPPKKAPAFEHPKRLVIRDRLIPPQRGQDFHDAVRPGGLPATWRTVSRSSLPFRKPAAPLMASNQTVRKCKKPAKDRAKTV